MNKRILVAALLLIGMISILVSCSGTRMSTIQTVEFVDLDRFMGDWYVIANIPTSIEKGAHNAVETYRRGKDNQIETTFTFNQGGFEGESEQYNPTGFVGDDPSNAIWDMQFIWPFKSDYRIIWLDPDYQLTVVGRQARDYVWVMARQPSITAAKLVEIKQYLVDQGYDISQLQMVPQRWP